MPVDVWTLTFQDETDTELSHSAPAIVQEDRLSRTEHRGDIVPAGGGFGFGGHHPEITVAEEVGFGVVRNSSDPSQTWYYHWPWETSMMTVIT